MSFSTNPHISIFNTRKPLSLNCTAFITPFCSRSSYCTNSSTARTAGSGTLSKSNTLSKRQMLAKPSRAWPSCFEMGKTMSSMLRAIGVIGLSFSHFFALRLPPVFPVPAIKTLLLTKYLPCWTFEISYVIDLHTWVIVILQNMSGVYRKVGTGIENARVDSE